MADVEKAACDAIDAAKGDLHSISREIWEHPEENYEEVHAHAAITNFLEKYGFDVKRHYVVNTGFSATTDSSSDGPHIAVLCEYDALPDIGHACGHNLIAEAGLAAGIGIKAAFEANGKPLGKLTVLGTPAEEGGGGKIDMINAHVFDDVDAAMMAHPCLFNLADISTLAINRVKVKFHGKASHASAFPWNGVNALDAAVLCYQNVSCMRQQCKPDWRIHVTVKYHGKASHASGFPWKGVNALDAAVLCYQSVSCMRQQCKPDWRIHGIIKNGGAKPNIIPELTELEFYARTPTKKELQTLIEKLENCFKSAAIATGCRCEMEWNNKPFFDMVSNSVMSDLYTKHALKLGVDFVNHPSTGETGSTDMGNVSYVVPSIHPFFYIGSTAVNHTRDFTVASGDDKAQSYTLTVAKAMALTAIDMYTHPEKMKAAKEEFEKRTK